MLRCFRFSYGCAPDVIRWIDDVGELFSRQIFQISCDTCVLEYTGDDTGGYFLSGIPQLIEAGRCEELT